jgi:hypothetical protein
MCAFLHRSMWMLTQHGLLSHSDNSKVLSIFQLLSTTFCLLLCYYSQHSERCAFRAALNNVPALCTYVSNSDSQLINFSCVFSFSVEMFPLQLSASASVSLADNIYGHTQLVQFILISCIDLVHCGIMYRFGSTFHIPNEVDDSSIS